MSLRSAVRTSAHSEARCRFPAYSANNTMLRCAYIHQAELSQQKPSTNLRQAIQSQGSSEDMQANAKPTVRNKLMLAKPKIKTMQPEQNPEFKTNQPQFESHTSTMLEAQIQEAGTKDAPARNEPDIHTGSPKATLDPFICTAPFKKNSIPPNACCSSFCSCPCSCS